MDAAIETLIPAQSTGKIKTRAEKAALALQVISTASVVLAAIGVWVAYEAYTGEHEWNRRLYTMELIRNYDRDAKHHSDKLNQYFPGLLYRSQEKSLSEEEARDIYFLPSSETTKFTPALPGTEKGLSADEVRERREHVIAFLNYMEYVCKAYEAQVVDQQIIYESFAGLFIRRFTYFESIIKLAQEEQKSTDSWGPIRRVVGEWRRRNEAEIKSQPRTG